MSQKRKDNRGRILRQKEVDIKQDILKKENFGHKKINRIKIFTPNYKELCRITLKTWKNNNDRKTRKSV